MDTSLQALSNDLAAAVERAAPSVLAVNGRERTPSSGVLWRKGVVVTADHTLKRDDDVTVTPLGGKPLPATVAGRDPGTDLAVLKVADLDSPEAETGDPASLKVGHLVVAVGRGPNASLGVISSLNGPWRTWRGGLVDQLVRLDLSIYTGFSGGPLIDAQGRVLGVNTSGLSRGGGLTVPVSTVNRVVEELLAKGRIARGYLGIGMQAVRLSDSVRSRAGINSQAGLIVLSVEPGGPADAGGVLLGDVLIGIDSTDLLDTDDLQIALGSDRIGKAAKLRVIRGGSVVEIPVVIGERPGRD
jgi:S1-C subfamily serine protease